MTGAVAAGVTSISDEWLARHLPSRERRAHKGDFGRVLVVGGSVEYPGAALLAGLGALRAGAGLVRIATAGSVAERLAGAVPELTWMPLDEEAEGSIGPGGWRHLTSAVTEYDALVIGPGLGRLPTTQRRTRALLGTVRVPTVIDADALNALAGATRWWSGLPPASVLTPHSGELARLTGESSPAAAEDGARLAAASAAAERWGQTLVLKGARTVVAGQGGVALVSPVETPALATAGTGDVLAGAIGALLAAGLAPTDAAACGVGLHAAAGVLAEQRHGSAGALATDVAALLPSARRLASESSR